MSEITFETIDTLAGRLNHEADVFAGDNQAWRKDWGEQEGIKIEEISKEVSRNLAPIVPDAMEGGPVTVLAYLEATYMVGLQVGWELRKARELEEMVNR